MATYNGEKYIIQQLLSIVRQTLIPDEVIIVDDGSSDCTFSLIQEFIEKYKNIEWKLFRNDVNLGWQKKLY